MKSILPAAAAKESAHRKGLACSTLLGLILLAVFPQTARPETVDKGGPRLRLSPYEYHPGPGGENGLAVLSHFTLSTGQTRGKADSESDHDSLSLSIAPWTGLGHNALKMFSGSNAILHLTAAAASALIVVTGLDTQVHNFFVRNPGIDRFSRPGVGIGTTLPVYLGAAVLGSGLIGGSSSLVSAGGAVLQASLLALCYTTTLKALTGRPGPEPVLYEDNEASQTFQFGFLRGGVFHGWPSGHMLANTAAVTSLLAFYHHSTWLKVAGGAYLSYLFLSVISHHGSAMHWFSDTVAGILMGYAIGTTVGSDFRERWENKQPKPAGLNLSLIPSFLSASFSISF